MPNVTTQSSPVIRSLQLLFVIALTCLAAIVATANTQKAPTIAGIEFEGLQRLPAEQVIAASGLKVGQPFDVAALDAAAQKLADSGLFKNFGYRTRREGNSIRIIFRVEESKKGSGRVVFDNFIWFSDEQLAEAVRREVPAFAGTAPDAGEMTDSITRALQKLLKANNLEGSVEYLPSSSPTGLEHLFRVSGVKLPVCTLHFPGAQNISEAKLIKSSQELIENDYSQAFSSLFAKGTLGALYRELGQLRARFERPLAKPDADPKCRGGVDLTIPVEEGLIYSWQKSEWTENQVIAAPELEATLGMKTGELANGLKFDKGLAAVTKAYGRKGYIDVRFIEQPEFDDAAKRVTYKIAVKEGPQYRMGTLTLKGFPPDTEKLFRAKWTMNPGDVFDDGYLEEFMKTSMNEVLKRLATDNLSLGRPLPSFETQQKPKKETLTVDLTVGTRN